MDNIVNELIKWLLINFPVVLIILVPIIVALYILKEIKEIFFTSDNEGETFGVKLKRFIMPWTRKKGKIKEPSNIKYSDDERIEIISKLLIHNFFQAVSIMKTNIPTIEFGSQKKNLILRDVILIYVETIEEHVSDFIKNRRIDELNTQQFNEIMIKEIIKIEFEIYSKMRSRLGEILHLKLIEDPVKGFKVRNAIFKEIFVNSVLLMSSQSMSVYQYDNYKIPN